MPRRGGYQPPANVAFGTMLPGKANGMIRRCIHSLSLGLWPIQLPRRGSLGYVLLFLALSYLYRHTESPLPPFRQGGAFCCDECVKLSPCEGKPLGAYHILTQLYNNKKTTCKSKWFFLKADTRIRTGDLILTKDALYLLSYISIRPGWGSNPRPPA